MFLTEDNSFTHLPQYAPLNRTAIPLHGNTVDLVSKHLLHSTDHQAPQ